MERKLAPLQQNWEDYVRAWKARKKQREAFNSCTTPSERANCDARRFLDYYFLTNGEPDQTKTPEAFAVYGLDDMLPLERMVAGIPGLHLSGGYYEDRTFCIGWDRLAVGRLILAIRRQAHEEERRKQESEWEKVMEAHHDYVLKSNKGSSAECKREGTGKGRPSQSFQLGRCTGSYIVKCDTVSDEWPGMGGFTMDIGDGKNGTLIAHYHFGVIEGTMLLSTCQETLDALAGTWHDSDDGSENSFDSEEYDKYDGDDEDDEKSESKKRTNQDIDTSKEGASKRHKFTLYPARRVYYRLRGCDTGEGDIIHDPESGHLDFIGDSYATFVGLAYSLPWVGGNVEFRGYKVSDVPQRQATDWDDLTREAYESESGIIWY